MRDVHIYNDCDMRPDGWLFIDGTVDDGGRRYDAVFALPPEAVRAIVLAATRPSWGMYGDGPR